MKDYIEERVLELAAYVLETQTTVRGAAKHFKISKSTVHKDLTERLRELNPVLAQEVKHVLDWPLARSTWRKKECPERR